MMSEAMKKEFLRERLKKIEDRIWKERMETFTTLESVRALLIQQACEHEWEYEGCKLCGIKRKDVE